MKAIFAALFAATLFSGLGQTVAEPIVVEERTLFTCPKYCTFPAHAYPVCNILSPCDFICKDGYTPYPLLGKTQKCVCSWPLTECNGKCGLFHGCSSKGHGKRELTAETAKCPVGTSACGVLGKHLGSWECIDTQKDLESCGGCMVGLSGDLNAQGQDCTAIHGVSDVACVRGQCQVNKCMDGYEVSTNGTTCTPIERKKTLFNVAEEVLAAQFGS